MRVEEYIDHTYLKADGTVKIITNLCQEAIKYNFKAVCVNACWVKLASSLLRDSTTEVASVVGFPLGATTTACKVFETKQVIEDGATEIDLVMNIGMFLSCNYQYVLDEISAVVEAAGNMPVKVIIETALLDKKQIVKACEISEQAGASYVKTSTGFGPSGAKIEDVKLMRKSVSPHTGVKASGGVRSFIQAKDMIEAGATRIGTSSGIKIVTEGNEFK